MNRPGPWPALNQLVELHTPGASAWFPSRVEDREERRLVVAAPFDPTGRLLVVEPGDRVTVRWVEQQGLARLDTSVTGGRDGRVPLWDLEADHLPVLHQRRRFARVPVMVPVRVLRGTGESLVVTLDLAEGGALCASPRTAPFEPEERVRLTFEVDGRRLDAEARVVRSRAARGGGVTVAFRFVSLPGRDADHLRRFVYKRQLHLATAGRR